MCQAIFVGAKTRLFRQKKVKNGIITFVVCSKEFENGQGSSHLIVMLPPPYKE